MTGMPEAILSRELELPYATISVVANYAAGRGDSLHAIHFSAVEPILQESLGRVRLIIEQLVGHTIGMQPMGMSV